MVDPFGLELLRQLAIFGEGCEVSGELLSGRLRMPLEDVSAIAVYLQRQGLVCLRTRGALVQYAAITTAGLRAVPVVPASAANNVFVYSGNVQLGTNNQQISQKPVVEPEDGSEESDDSDDEEVVIDRTTVIRANKEWRSDLYKLKREESICITISSNGCVDLILLTESQLSDLDGKNYDCLDAHKQVTRTRLDWDAPKRSEICVVIQNNERQTVEVDMEVIIITRR